MPKMYQTTLYVFADDITLTTTLKETDYNLEIAISRLENYIDKWRIELNTSRRQAVLFSKRRRHNYPMIELNGDPIKWTTNAKYLGIAFDEKLTWTHHIGEAMKKAISRNPNEL